MSETKDKLAAVNKLNDKRDLFVEGFLKNPRTLGIVVHSHKVDTQEHPNFAVNRVSVNIFHRSSMLSAMGPLTKMLMTNLLKRTHRNGQLKDRERDKFKLYHSYNKFLQETKENNRLKYAFKSNCVTKTLVAFEPIQNMEITSLYIDIVTSSETQLNIQNIVV